MNNCTNPLRQARKGRAACRGQKKREENGRSEKFKYARNN